MRKHIKTISWVVGVLIISALLIGFESVESNSKVCNDIIITIDNQLENHFVDDNDIVDLITLNGTEIIEGAHVSKLNLREIEQRLGLKKANGTCGSL